MSIYKITHYSILYLFYCTDLTFLVIKQYECAILINMIHQIKNSRGLYRQIAHVYPRYVFPVESFDLTGAAVGEAAADEGGALPSYTPPLTPI